MVFAQLVDKIRTLASAKMVGKVQIVMLKQKHVNSTLAKIMARVQRMDQMITLAIAKRVGKEQFVNMK